jgi:cobalt-zinc-cadmium resistance protein CzcA
MIEKLISSSLEHRLLVVFVVLLIAAWGIYSYTELSIDAFPDVTNIQVEILGYAPGRAPLEVERFLTYPLEMSLRGLPGLDQLRSVSKFGLSVITAVFKDNVDIYFARQLVLERLIEARQGLPQNVTVSLGPVSTAMGEIYQYTLEAPEPTGEAERVRQLTELRTIQDWVISPILKTVPGVNEVNSFGGYIKQYQAVVDPARLLRHGVTLSEVVEALERNNRNAGGNVLELYDQQYLIRGTGLMQSVEAISRTVVKAEAGVPVTVGDLAEVRVGHAVRQGASVKDGKKEVVGGIVMMLRGENGRRVVEAVQAKVEEINAGRILPEGVKMEPFYKRSDIIKASVGTVTRALQEGAVLVIIVLFLFLGSVRGALIVVLSMPLAVLVTFIAMKNLGLTANLMSLGGLAISIGMIVDASIIQVENIQRHLAERGRADGKLATVLEAVLEVRKPSIFGELIIVITFLPVMTLTGIEGKMFSPLALTLALALAASLLLSVFVIPVVCFYLLRPEPDRKSLIMSLAVKVYEPALSWALRRKAVVLAAALALLGATAFVYPRLGREFMPVMDEGAFDMDIQFLPGISLEKSVELSLEVERELMKFPELVTVVSRTGQTGVALEARGVEKTGYVGALRPRREWKSARTREELTEKFREAVAHIPGMSFSFSQPIACRIDEIVSGARSQLIVKLFGYDMEVLKRKAGEIAAVLARMRGTEDLNVERVSGQPTIIVSADLERAARHGLGAGDVMDVVETAVGGKPVTQVYEGDRFFDLVVRYPESERGSVEAIRGILVATPRGYSLPLADVARVEEVEGPVQISREFGRRRIGIECNVAGRDIGRFVAEAKRRVAAEVDLPEGYYLNWGGQFENQQRAARRLSLIVPATLGLVFLLLFFTFGELGPAALVFLNLPFALVGGIFSLYISGQYLSVPASVGFIVLLGIAVLNGVVVVSHIRQLGRECATQLEATKRACGNRLRPVLMTAATTVFGLTPLLFASGPGSEVQRPLAVVVIGGLLTSTALTLIVLPTLYDWLARSKK